MVFFSIDIHYIIAASETSKIISNLSNDVTFYNSSIHNPVSDIIYDQRKDVPTNRFKKFIYIVVFYHKSLKKAPFMCPNQSDIGRKLNSIRLIIVLVTINQTSPVNVRSKKNIYI